MLQKHSFSVDDVIKASEAMVVEAETILKEMARDYDVSLLDQLQKLRRALLIKDYQWGLQLVYKIETVAGTYDWPLVSQTAQSLRQCLVSLNPYDVLPDNIRKMHLGAMYLFVEKNMKGSDPRGRVIIDTLSKLH